MNINIMVDIDIHISGSPIIAQSGSHTTQAETVFDVNGESTL